MVDELGVAYDLPQGQRRAQRQAAQEVLRTKQQVQHWFMESMASGLLVTFISINLVAYTGETSCGGFRTWLMGSMGIYIFDMIVSMNQLMAVKKGTNESLCLLLGSLIVLIVNTGWYIYGNVIFYSEEPTCIAHPMDGYPNGYAPGLTSAMRFMIYIGYITMCKCCMVSTLCAIALPCLIVAYRNQN